MGKGGIERELRCNLRKAKCINLDMHNNIAKAGTIIEASSYMLVVFVFMLTLAIRIFKCKYLG